MTLRVSSSCSRASTAPTTRCCSKASTRSAGSAAASPSSMRTCGDRCRSRPTGNGAACAGCASIFTARSARPGRSATISMPCRSSPAALGWHVEVIAPIRVLLDHARPDRRVAGGSRHRSLRRLWRRDAGKRRGPRAAGAARAAACLDEAVGALSGVRQSVADQARPGLADGDPRPRPATVASGAATGRIRRRTISRRAATSKRRIARISYNALVDDFLAALGSAELARDDPGDQPGAALPLRRGLESASSSPPAPCPSAGRWRARWSRTPPSRTGSRCRR